ncbi:DUF1883 domain-containing protein [Streptomyces lavendulocolor]|uniref:DUF1883 domain-containing protein n=1 Tax=Streptomyces lavendulocolor TaxID=67316 RepID=UPI003C2DF994
MDHLYKDLGNLKGGSAVIVTLRNQANVQVMMRSEYSKYKSGRTYRYLGGRVTRSPHRITIPSNGHWVVAIDLGGYSGRIAASVQVQPPPRGFLPPAQQAQGSPARSVAVHEPEEPAGGVLGGQTWDVFISHASAGPVVCRPRVADDRASCPHCDSARRTPVRPNSSLCRHTCWRSPARERLRRRRYRPTSRCRRTSDSRVPWPYQ